MFNRRLMEQNQRLLSLDALRGFNMMFIVGIAELICKICIAVTGNDAFWLAVQMHHVSWEGLHHHDTIFPLFLFMAGVSFPFSYAKQLSKGASRGRIYRKIITRGIILVFLGLVYNGFFKLKFDSLRFYSVLALIGMSWMFAALLYINFKTKTRVFIAAGLLILYWLLIRFVPTPEALQYGPYTKDGSLVGYIDRILFPGHLCWGDFDPEGLLSYMSSTVTAMLGMFSGDFIRSGKYSGGKKTLLMLGAAAALTGAGLLWSLEFPIIKAIWSSTFTLVVGGYSVAMLAIFYYIIDVRGWKGWTLPFAVIGMNSITAYMGRKIIDFNDIGWFFLRGVIDRCPEAWGPVVAEAGGFIALWLFLYFLYKKKVFIKV